MMIMVMGLFRCRIMRIIYQKQQIKMRTFVSTLPKCPICGGYLDNKSISIDHIRRKSELEGEILCQQ